MNRKELSEILDGAVQVSQAKYCDGGLRYQLNQVSAYSDMLSESINAHKAMGNRGYAIKELVPVTEEELKEALIEFTEQPLGNKATIFTQNLISSINSGISPYTAQLWEASYEGYGLALVLSFESENGGLVLAMEWTID